MALADRAVGGALWSISAGLLSRGVGLVGTLIMTRYLAPEVMGEVTTATILAFTVSWATQMGFPKYLILRAGEGPEPVFHVLVLSLTLVGVPLLLLVAGSAWLADWFSTPHLPAYLPGMALTVFIRRIGSVPEKLLLRDMRFRVVAAATGAAELSYAAVALLLVTQFGLGGQGIVIGNIVQATLLAVLLTAACGTSSWLTPVRLRSARFREILAYGLPLGAMTFLYEFARYGDKLLFTKLFGPARTGEYNLASNLADVPSVQVGEQVSNVLLPTLMQVEGQRRREVLIKAVAMQVAIILPMALGLATIAPTLVRFLLPEKWWGMTPFLMVLAATAVFRPVNALLAQYLLTMDRNHRLLRLEVVRVAAMFASMLLLGQAGPVEAAFAIGASSLLHTVLLARSISQQEGVSIPAMLAATRPAVIASLAMAAAVLVLRKLPVWHDAATLLLLAGEILTGGLVYAGVFTLVGPETVRDIRARLRGVFARGS